MVTVAYQGVFKITYDYRKIKDLLKSVYSESGISAEINDSNLEIRYYKPLNSEKFILGFSLSFIDEEENKIIERFSGKLRNLDECLNLIKLYDESIKEEYKNIFEKIYKIEMKIRELLTLIFVDSYKSDFYNLLKEIKVDTEGKPTNERFNDAFENEFFYLNFGKYKSLDKLKDLTHEDLFEFAESSNEFKDFKEKITQRGIIKDYEPFLFELKSFMDPLEKIRNCIMHSRRLNNDLKGYESTLESVSNKLDAFENSIKTPISAKVLIKEISPHKYSWKTLLEHEHLPITEVNLGEMTVVGGPEYQTEEFEEDMKNSLLDNLEGLDYDTVNLSDDKEMIEIEYVQ